MKLRSAAVGDAASLARGMRVVIEEGDYLATQRSTGVAELEERFATGISDDHILVVCDEDGDVMACTGLQPTRVEGVWSLGTWVLPEHRRQGLAKRMIQQAVQRARERDIRKVELEAFSDNDAALTLFATCGFEREGVRRDHYQRDDGTLKSAVLMALFP